MYMVLIIYGIILILTVKRFASSVSEKPQKQVRMPISLNYQEDSANTYLQKILKNEKETSKKTKLNDSIDTHLKKPKQKSIVESTKGNNETSIQHKTHYSPPIGDGEISESQENIVYIEAGQIIHARLTEPLSSQQTHSIQAKITGSIKINGQLYPAKDAMISGDFRCDEKQDRFFMQFSTLFIGNKGHSIAAHVIESNGKRGLIADRIESQKTKAIINSVIGIAKNIASTAATGYSSPHIPAPSVQITSKSTKKHLYLNPTLLRVQIQFPIAIKENLL